MCDVYKNAVYGYICLWTFCVGHSKLHHVGNRLHRFVNALACACVRACVPKHVCSLGFLGTIASSVIVALSSVKW